MDNIQQTKLEQQKTDFKNRLHKRYSHLRKWAKRTNTSCYRIYDKDIPEIPLAVDIYHGVRQTDYGAKIETSQAELPEAFLHIYLYERPYEKDPQEEKQWLSEMTNGAAEVLNIPQCNIFSKTRKKQKGDVQYEKIENRSFNLIVHEQGQKLIVNLSDYLDTGLFFDHRPLRQCIKEQASEKDVLNLFCYTGSFSVYAAAGGAASVDSVDLSKNYLNWAKNNLSLNGFNADFPDQKYRLINEDVVGFIQAAKNATKAFRNRWDIIILDPPTFSNSKKTETTLDINRDWPMLVNTCIGLLKPQGILYFSSNSRKFKFEPALIVPQTEQGGLVTISDITDVTIPEDFRNQKIHRCWKISI